METEQVTEGFDFGHWVRTGRLIRIDPRWGAREVKFNPNHDPRDGRFTFAEGGGAAGMSRPPSKRPQVGREDPRIVADEERRRQRNWANDPRNPRNQTTYTVQPGDTLHHIAATRGWLTPEYLQKLNGLNDDHIVVGQQIRLPSQQSLDASKRTLDDGNALLVYTFAHGDHPPPVGSHVPSLEEQTFGPGTHTEVRNGYTFYIDGQGRTRDVKGTITNKPSQGRSKSAQANAGKPDRLSTDVGGHYIARRFNGPTETFNHFAQDGRFNKSAYAKLENDWAAATKRGEQVYVTIEPAYVGASQRPASISVGWTVGGDSYARSFLNNRSARHVR